MYRGLVDAVQIFACSGNGGAGCVSFHRARGQPKGGPDGGDGGRGGGVYFEVRRNLRTLSHLRSRERLQAEAGQPGMGQRKHGRKGTSLVIAVPPGTSVREGETGALLKDFGNSPEGVSWECLQGGTGGLGNWHFRSSRNQAPRYAQEGRAGSTLSLLVELTVIADVGFVGYPNAGKSTLLNTLTRAHSRVGDYPFTTKIPHLGVLKTSDGEIVLGDLPGLLEGASRGVGLGTRFLKHVMRTKALVFLIDLTQGRPYETFSALLQEIVQFDPALTEKRRLVVGTKRDLEGTARSLEELDRHLSGERVLGISSHSREGLENLTMAIMGELVCD